MSPQDTDIDHVRKAVEALSEHFDTVQIFTTRYEGGDKETVSVCLGTGNWYARVGQVQGWAARSDENEREDVRKEDEDG